MKPLWEWARYFQMIRLIIPRDNLNPFRSGAFFYCTFFTHNIEDIPLNLKNIYLNFWVQRYGFLTLLSRANV